MSEETNNSQDQRDTRGTIIIFVVSILVAILFRIQFKVQSEYALAFILSMPVVVLAISRGFRNGALAAIVSAAIYGVFLIFSRATGDSIETARLNLEIINIAVIITSGFILGLLSEFLNFREPFKEATTIVETFVPDEETGLYNFKSFRWMLRGEVKRIKRYNRPMSIVFLKIDNLDVFQKRYDYQQEISLFKEIGLYLRAMLREADYVGKHSDNEIGIVLPETPIGGSDIVCKRLEETIPVLSKKLNKIWDEIQLSFYYSHANYPRDASNLDELIDVLDARYQSL